MIKWIKNLFKKKDPNDESYKTSYGIHIGRLSINWSKRISN